ncbi:ATP-binding cassette domain-containing protein [Nonomuraea ferruginea]
MSIQAILPAVIGGVGTVWGAADRRGGAGPAVGRGRDGGPHAARVPLLPPGPQRAGRDHVRRAPDRRGPGHATRSVRRLRQEVAMILRMEGVSKAFGGLRALDSVTFEVERGTIHAVIGPNGAGKTTLFSVISGEQRPESGRILFDGQDVTARPAHLRARADLVRTFQLTRPFPALSVLDNVTVAA